MLAIIMKGRGLKEGAGMGINLNLISADSLWDTPVI